AMPGTDPLDVYCHTCQPLPPQLPAGVEGPLQPVHQFATQSGSLAKAPDPTLPSHQAGEVYMAGSCPSAAPMSCTITPRLEATAAPVNPSVVSTSIAGRIWPGPKLTDCNCCSSRFACALGSCPGRK